MGMVSFQVRQRSRYFDKDGLLLTVTAETTNAAQRLFFANDKLSSYVDPQSLLPYRSEFQIVEGKRRGSDILTINQEYGTATNQQGRKIEMPVGTHDYLSIFYAARTMNLSPPKRNAVSLMGGSRAPRSRKPDSGRTDTISITVRACWASWNVMNPGSSAL